jgi:hypothetical protein
LDAGNCRCCDFADFNRYTSLKTELAKIETRLSTQTITAELQSQIDALKKSIADIEAAVIGSCGSTTFQFVFNPSKCKLTCDEANGFVPVYKRCECIFLQGYDKLYAQQAHYNALYNRLIKTVYDTVEFYEVRTAFNVEFNYMWQITKGLQWDWDRYTLEEKNAALTEVSTRTNTITTRVETYINSPPGTCGNTCAYFSLPEASNNCQCDQSAPVVDFYNNHEKFKGIENEILAADFKEYKDDEIRFENWAKEVRRKGTEVYNGVAVAGISAEEKRSRADAFIVDYEALKAEWLAFKIKLIPAVTTCSLTCSGDTVKRCNPCKCAAVSGWENLITVIDPDVNNVLAEIESLSAEESLKTTLRNNANTLKSGLTQVKSYAADNCDGLDVASVTQSTNQLTTMYSNIKGQIIQVRNSASSGQCQVTCPNSRWVLDQAACKCKCLPFTCNPSTDAIDPYNCQCSAKSSCTKTQSECGSQGLFLDYAACDCKAGNA